MKKSFKIWAKRIFHIWGILRFEIRRFRLKISGAQLEPGCALSPIKHSGKLSRLRISSGAFVGRIEIALHANVEIGAYAILNDGVKILTASHIVNSSDFQQIAKPVVIGKYAWICTGSLILPGVKIGEGAVVGAGAVVSKDVEAFTIVAGNPARVIGRKRNPYLTYNPVKFLAPYEAWK